MSETGKKKGAILVALDPAAPGSAGLEILRHFADRRSWELLGLFIEDIELLAHAQSRLAREVVHSGAARPLEITSLERQLRAQSAAIRRIFEHEATRLGLPHAFKVLRGGLVTELAGAASNAEILVIELAQRASGGQSLWVRHLEQLCIADLPTVLYVREGWTTGSTVLAIIAEPGDIEATARAAARLARAGDATLTVMVGERAQAHEEAIEAALGAHARRGALRLERVSSADLGARALAFLARSGGACALVAPARLAKLEPTLIRELLRRTRCSVMLVNPTREA